MRAEVAQHIAGAGMGRVHAPARGRAGGFHRLAVKAVRELHLHDADLAQLALRDHLARLLHELVARVAVGHAHDPPAGTRQLQQLQSFGRGEAQRLFADHVQPCQQRGPADLEMGVVGRGDGHGADAVRAARLGLEHGAVVGIAALRIQAQPLAELPAAHRVDVEGPSHQLQAVVALRRRSVHRADLAVLSPADHGPGNRVAGHGCCVDHGVHLQLW